jgi:hypothetical protein
LAPLEWSCAEGHTPDEWGVTLASISYRASPAVIKRMSGLGANPNLTNDNEKDPHYGQEKGALHVVHDNKVETLQILLDAGARVEILEFDLRSWTTVML